MDIGSLMSGYGILYPQDDTSMSGSHRNSRIHVFDLCRLHVDRGVFQSRRRQIHRTCHNRFFRSEAGMSVLLSCIIGSATRFDRWHDGYTRLQAARSADIVSGIGIYVQYRFPNSWYRSLENREIYTGSHSHSDDRNRDMLVCSMNGHRDILCREPIVLVSSHISWIPVSTSSCEPQTIYWCFRIFLQVIQQCCQRFRSIGTRYSNRYFCKIVGRVIIFGIIKDIPGIIMSFMESAEIQHRCTVILIPIILPGNQIDLDTVLVHVYISRCAWWLYRAEKLYILRTNSDMELLPSAIVSLDSSSLSL